MYHEDELFEAIAPKIVQLTDYKFRRPAELGGLLLAIDGAVMGTCDDRSDVLRAEIGRYAEGRFCVIERNVKVETNVVDGASVMIAAEGYREVAGAPFATVSQMLT